MPETIDCAGTHAKISYITIPTITGQPSVKSISLIMPFQKKHILMAVNIRQLCYLEESYSPVIITLNSPISCMATDNSTCVICTGSTAIFRDPSGSMDNKHPIRFTSKIAHITPLQPGTEMGTYKVILEDGSQHEIIADKKEGIFRLIAQLPPSASSTAAKVSRTKAGLAGNILTLPFSTINKFNTGSSGKIVFHPAKEPGCHYVALSGTGSRNQASLDKNWGDFYPDLLSPFESINTTSFYKNMVRDLRQSRLNQSMHAISFHKNRILILKKGIAGILEAIKTESRINCLAIAQDGTYYAGLENGKILTIAITAS